MGYKRTKGVYSIRCSFNGMQYFGSSSRSIENRISWHKCQLKKGVHNNPELQEDYNKYGSSSFTYHIEYITDNHDDILTEEQQLISMYKCYNYFYNEDTDWSEINKKKSKARDKVTSNPKWKKMQSELTRKQHRDKRFPCYKT